MRKRFGIILVLCVISLTFFVQDTYAQKDAVLDAFYEADAAYKSEDYKAASEKYEQMILLGLESGQLYYNLGNSYFKDGQLGKAMLSYQRAREYIPRDSDLESNSKYVKTFLSAQPKLQESFLIRKFKGLFDFVTIGECAFLIVMILFVMAVLHILSLYLKWERFKLLVFEVVFFILLVLNVLGIVHKARVHNSTAVVVSDSQARFEPREGATVHFDLPQGWTVKVIKNQGGWIKIERFDNKVGWVPQDTLKKVKRTFVSVMK